MGRPLNHRHSNLLGNLLKLLETEPPSDTNYPPRVTLSSELLSFFQVDTTDFPMPQFHPLVKPVPQSNRIQSFVFFCLYISSWAEISTKTLQLTKWYRFQAKDSGVCVTLAFPLSEHAHINKTEVALGLGSFIHFRDCSNFYLKEKNIHVCSCWINLRP